MDTQFKPKLDIIVPFHGKDISCINNLQPPDNLMEVMRTIFVYDGDLTDHKSYNIIKASLAGSSEMVSNLKANGAGGSRNLGLRAAKAEYLIFADSDDYINFKALYDRLKENDGFDITFYKSESKFDDLSGAESFRNASYNDAIDKYVGSGNKESLKNIYVPWSKIFRREFLIAHKVEFNEVEASNDVMFSISALVKAKKIGTNSKSFYTVIDSKKSLTKNLTKSSVISRYSELSKYNCFLRQNTDWKLHPMSAQIYLCFRVSVPLGIRAVALSIYNRFPLFYSAIHVIRILKQRGFSFLK